MSLGSKFSDIHRFLVVRHASRNKPESVGRLKTEKSIPLGNLDDNRLSIQPVSLNMVTNLVILIFHDVGSITVQYLLDLMISCVVRSMPILRTMILMNCTDSHAFPRAKVGIQIEAPRGGTNLESRSKAEHTVGRLSVTSDKVAT